MRMTFNIAGAAATAIAALTVAAAPMPAAAQRSNSVTSCDAPGGRQEAGAVIGALVGGAIGNRVARNERGIGTVVGAGAGAAAGSYIGCRQQVDRARRGGYARGGGDYYATTNLRVRSGPGQRYAAVGNLGRGETFDVVNRRGGWVQIDGGGWVSSRYVGAN